MNAAVGDKVHFKSHTVGVEERVAVVTEVHGSGGTPPYVVRFSDGHQVLVYPGPDAIIEICTEDHVH